MVASDAAKNLGRRIENKEGTTKIAPSMFTSIRMESSWAISAWKRRLLKDHHTIPPIRVVAVKDTAIPVVRIARRIPSFRSPPQEYSCRMRSVM